MNFNEAKKIATDFYNEKGGLSISKIYESDTFWIVYALKDGLTPIGAPGLTIDKKTGKTGKFILPNPQNFAILKKAKLVFDSLNNS